MPEEEEDDDKKAKGKKDGKKADKGKKDGKKGGKDKGGSKGGSKKDSKSGSGGKEGKGKDKDKGKDKGKEKGKDKDKGKKPDTDKGSKDDKHKDEKGKDEKGKDEKHKDGKDKADKEAEPDFVSPPIPARSGGMYKLWELEKAKKKEEGSEKKPHTEIGHMDHHGAAEALSPLDPGHKEDEKKHDKADTGHKEDAKKHDKADAGHKEDAKEHDKADKSSDKSSLKSASSTEKSKTSKTDTTDKSESESDDHMDHPKKKSSSKTHAKSGEPSSRRTVVRTITSRGPVFADNSYGDESDDDGSRSYIEIQMFGRQYHGGAPADQRWAPPSQGQAQPWEHGYRDGASQQRQVEWANQQFYRGPDSGGLSDQHRSYDDGASFVWQAPQHDQAGNQTALCPADAGGRSALVAQRLREVHQGLQQPMTDDLVSSTERVIYEVTRTVPSKLSSMSLVDAAGRPTSHAPGGGALVLSSQATSQFQCPTTGSQAVVRHEMRQSSATQLQAMVPAGRQASKGMMYGHPSTNAAAYGGGVPPESVATAQRRQADILTQQASLINQQSSIIQQQSNIIEQQLGLLSALRGQDGGQPNHDVPQEHVGPSAGTAPYGSVFFAVDYHDTNQMSRNPWMRRM